MSCVNPKGARRYTYPLNLATFKWHTCRSRIFSCSSMLYMELQPIIYQIQIKIVEKTLAPSDQTSVVFYVVVTIIIYITHYLFDNM